METGVLGKVMLFCIGFSILNFFILFFGCGLIGMLVIFFLKCVFLLLSILGSIIMLMVINIMVLIKWF